jgi:succinate dehydrogenase hydrophobic anchor subunit
MLQNSIQQANRYTFAFMASVFFYSTSHAWNTLERCIDEYTPHEKAAKV